MALLLYKFKIEKFEWRVRPLGGKDASHSLPIQNIIKLALRRMKNCAIHSKLRPNALMNDLVNDCVM
jgi:hypothetical protein